jgi:hypothetical protein
MQAVDVVNGLGTFALSGEMEKQTSDKYSVSLVMQ